MSSSRSNSSVCARIETYSPAAIETAPAISPARPARRTTPAAGLAPATPRMSDTFDTSPSDTPNTAARAAPAWMSRWWCSIDGWMAWVTAMPGTRTDGTDGSTSVHRYREAQP